MITGESLIFIWVKYARALFSFVEFEYWHEVQYQGKETESFDILKFSIIFKFLNGITNFETNSR